MKEKIPKELAESFLEFLKNFKFSDLDLKNLGIESIKIIVVGESESTSEPTVIIKYLEGFEEKIIGVVNILNKLKAIHGKT